MDIFTLAAKLSLDSSDFEKGINKAERQGSSLASKLGGGLAKAGKIAAAGISAGYSATTAFLTKLTKSAVNAYGEYEQLVGGAKLVYEDAYEEVEARAKKAYSNVQMSASDYMRQVNGLAVGLKSAMGGNAKAAADLADKVVTAEADVVAAMGISQEAAQNAFNGIMRGNYMMLDNLQIGIKGSKEGMQDVIDKVNKWNKENGKATKYNIKNLADQQAALVDYIEMVGLAGYAQSEGLTTLQGSLSATRAAWENFKVAIADPNGNVGDAIKGMVNSAKGAFRNLMPIARQTISGIATAVKELAPVIGRELPGIIGELAPQVWEIFKGFVTGVWDGLTSALGEVKWPTWDDVKAAAGIAWENIKTGAQALGGIVFGRAEDGSVAWPDPTKLLNDFRSWWNETAKPALEGAMVWTLQLFGLPTESAEQIASVISGWWGNIVDAAQSVLSWALNLPDAPHDAGTQLHDIIVKWWDGVKAAAQGLLSWVLGVPDIADADGETIKKNISDWWTQKVKPGLVGILNFTLGLFGLPSVQKMKDEILRWWSETKAAVGELVLTITTKLNPLKMNSGNDTVDEIVNNTDLGTGVKNIMNNQQQNQNTLRKLLGFEKGTKYVPFDMPAIIHRGEEILTASQARHRNSEVDYGTIGAMIGEAVESAIGRVGVYMSGERVADLTSKRMQGNINANSRAKVRAMGG